MNTRKLAQQWLEEAEKYRGPVDNRVGTSDCYTDGLRRGIAIALRWCAEDLQGIKQARGYTKDSMRR